MYKTINTKLTGVYNSAKESAKKAKAKTVDVVSDVMVAPARMQLKRTMKQSDKDVKALKTARAYDDAPSFDSKGMPTDAMKARSAADEVRMRLTKKKK